MNTSKRFYVTFRTWHNLYKDWYIYINIYLTDLNFPSQKSVVTFFFVFCFGFRRPFFRIADLDFSGGQFFFNPSLLAALHRGRDPGDVFVHKSALESVPSHLDVRIDSTKVATVGWDSKVRAVFLVSLNLCRAVFFFGRWRKRTHYLSNDYRFHVLVFFFQGWIDILNWYWYIELVSNQLQWLQLLEYFSFAGMALSS